MSGRPPSGLQPSEVIWSGVCAVIAAGATAIFTQFLSPPADRWAIPYGLMVAAGIWLAGMAVLRMRR